MFKAIPGNNEFIISLSQEIRDVFGEPHKLPIKNGKVKIAIYGIEDWYDLKWLSLVSHFEINVPGDKFKGLMNVEFYDTNITFFRPISSKIPVFKTPISITKENTVFRVIPQFSRYAVSKAGVVIEVETKDVMRIYEPRENSISGANAKYPKVYLYNPENLQYKYVMVHRLVAMAWVPNPGNDFVCRPIVNHIDGNKANYHASNLEWCSFKENTVHAVVTGLREDNIECKVRDFNTGIVRDFSSLSQAEQFMGLKTKVLRTNKLGLRKSNLINGKYEFKLSSDDSPWFYEGRKEKVKPGRFMIKVTHEDGKTEEFHDTRDFAKAFGLWNCPGMKKQLALVKAKYPWKKFEVTDFYMSKNVQAYHLETKTITETKSMSEMSKRTGVALYDLEYCLRGHETMVQDGYAFRYKSDEPWDTNFVKRPVKRFDRLKAINRYTSEEIVFNSVREAAKTLKLCRKGIKVCLINGLQLRGWCFFKLPDVEQNVKVDKSDSHSSQ